MFSGAAKTEYVCSIRLQNRIRLQWKAPKFLRAPEDFSGAARRGQKTQYAGKIFKNDRFLQVVGPHDDEIVEKCKVFQGLDRNRKNVRFLRAFCPHDDEIVEKRKVFQGLKPKSLTHYGFYRVFALVTTKS